MPGWVRVDCDYAAEGLWTEHGASYDIQCFPISEDLKAELMAWQATFDAECRPWEKANRFDLKQHRRIGTALALRVKQELPDWTVVALDRLVQSDGSLGIRVPYPGEKQD